jgi:hypothetical protein
MQARLDFQRRVIVQPPGQDIHLFENQFAGEADAVREFLHRDFGQLEELFDRVGAECDPIFGGDSVPAAVRRMSAPRNSGCGEVESIWKESQFARAGPQGTSVDNARDYA